MDQLIERACGLDVHRDSIATCVRVPGPQGQRVQHVGTFGTTTADLLALRDWLEAHGVTHLAMESTGVYWKPVYYVLEDRFECLLVNAGPGQNESAGKHRSGRIRKGNRWLRRTLVLAAHAARHTKDTALAARYYRIARHRGQKKAIVAVAHTLLVIAYHVIAEQATYHELGFDYHDRRDADRARRRAVALLEKQGYLVTLERAA